MACSILDRSIAVNSFDGVAESRGDAGIRPASADFSAAPQTVQHFGRQQRQKAAEGAFELLDRQPMGQAGADRRHRGADGDDAEKCRQIDES